MSHSRAKFRSKAPLRIGLAGGGTDISPFCDLYGGYILSASINMYINCTIEETTTNTIEFCSQDEPKRVIYASERYLAFDGQLDLLKCIYNRVIKDYVNKPLSFRLTVYSDVAIGSGLGGSSTMVVAVLKAFIEWQKLQLSEYGIARLAYEIERIDCKLLGGKQDQYAAVFGGFNFIEFKSNKEVIVNPLEIQQWIINELEASLVLFSTGISRESAHIIKKRLDNEIRYIEQMEMIKDYAVQMKESLLTGDIKKFGEIMQLSWLAKRKTDYSTSNNIIDNIINSAIKAGAYGGKLCGAGGGGFIFIVTDSAFMQNIINSALKIHDGEIRNVSFSKKGAQAWTIYS